MQRCTVKYQQNTEYFWNVIFAKLTLRDFSETYFRFTNFHKGNSWIFTNLFFLRQLSATDKYKGVIKSLKNNYEVFLLSLYLTLNRSTQWSKYKKDELHKWTIKKIKCTYSVCLNAYSFMTLTTSKSRIFDVSVRPWYIIGSAGPSQRSTIEVIPKRE